MSVVKVSLFSQVLSHLDRNIVDKVVSNFKSDKYTKGIDTWTHLVSMLFMHLAQVYSVRDISSGLKSATGNLSHMGISRAPSKSSVSTINMKRDYKVFEQIYYDLLNRYEPSLARSRKKLYRIKRKMYLMDSSLIHLSLSLFDWAKYRTQKGAAKLHAVLDYDLGLPIYANITKGKYTDIQEAQNLEFKPGSVLIMDRAYADYKWYFNLDSNDVIFIVRIKRNVQYQVIEQRECDPKHEYIKSDQIIRLTGHYVSKKYPKDMRLITAYLPEKDLELKILTNNLSWTANTICEAYKARWDIEVFFKSLKQSFKLKSFIGFSPNAVKIQIWTSLIALLLLDYLKKRAKYKWYQSNLLSFIRINLFVKIDLYKWLDSPFIKQANAPPKWTLF